MNMKRILCLLLAFAVMLSVAAMPCISYADEDDEAAEDTRWENNDNDIYGGDIDKNDGKNGMEFAEGGSNTILTDIKDADLKKKVMFLCELGFMSAYDDGTFKPDEKITRADFLKAVLKGINYDPEGGSAEKYTFNDIGSNDENYNVMSAAVERGYVGIYGDKSIRPGGEISSVECAIALLKAMGYSEFVGVNGGYSKGFVNTAYALGFFKHVKQSNEGITRADAARLIYTALNTEMLIHSQAGDIHKYYTDKSMTMLSVYHSIYYADGNVSATNITSTGDKNRTGRQNILINDRIYRITNNGYNDYIGYDVEFWYKTDESYVYPEVVYMMPDSHVSELVVWADDIIGYSGGTFSYYENSRRKSVKILNGCDLIYNGKLMKSYDSSVYKIKNGYVKLVANNGSDYGLVFVNSYFNVSFKSINAVGSVVNILLNYGVRPLEFDVSNSNLVIDMYDLNGRMDVTISQQYYYDEDRKLQSKTILPSIPANSVLSVFADKSETINGMTGVSADAEYVKIIISDSSVEGRVDAVDSDGAIIGGKKYLISDSNYLNETNPIFKLGAEGKFVLDYSGKLTMWIPGSGADGYSYGYLINAKKKDKLGSKLQLKILTKSDEIKVFDCSSGVKINDKKPDNTAKALEELGKSAKYLDSTFTISQIIKYSLNSSGEVTGLETVTADIGTADGYDDKHLSRYKERGTYSCRKVYGYSLIDTRQKMTVFAGPSDVYFTVPQTETFDDNDYMASTEAWDDETNPKSLDVFDVSDTLRPKAVVIYSSVDVKAFNYPYLIVTKVFQKINSEGYETAAIQGYSGSTSREYEMDSSLFDSVKEGDIITVAGKKDGVVDKIEYIMNVFDALNDNIEDPAVRTIRPALNPEHDFKIYEAYDYDVSTRALILQRGSVLPATSKRSYQRVCYWFPKAASFHYGACYCEVSEDGKIKLASGAYSNVKGAANYGTGAASRIIVADSKNAYGVRLMVIVNKVK